MTALTQEQKLRYNRHIILDGFGREGQERLMQGRVLLVGVGGLGSPAALYLAAAGAGTLGIVDGDNVSLANLQRQIAHTTNDVGRLKVDSAEEKIKAINPPSISPSTLCSVASRVRSTQRATRNSRKR